MTASKIDLQVFCDKDNAKIGKPFSLGEYTYATNGHIAVRVPRDPNVPEIEAPPKIDACFAREFNPLASRRALKNPIPPAAAAKTKKCEECGGRGVEHECHSCKCKCWECEGSGWYEEIRYQSLEIGSRIFNVHAVRKILTLPSVLFDADGKGKAIGFTFDGGEGMLMPLRRKQDNHIEVEF